MPFDVAAGALVYLDTNVFDPEHGSQKDQGYLVLGALRSPGLRLVFDLDCFFEPLLALRNINPVARPKAIRQLERMLKWCDLRRIVTSPEWLLTQAVLSYSGHLTQIGKFLDRGQLDEQLERELKNWDSVHSPTNAFWQSIASDVQQERKRFKNSFTTMLKDIGPRDGFAPGAKIPSFQEFWDAHKQRVAQTFVESVGRDAKQNDLWDICAQRGIDGLLNVRCMRLGVGIAIAFMYSHFYNEGQQIPKIQESDAADARHVIAASAAEIFVTNDARLFKRAAAIPIKDFKVISLEAFLADLQVGHFATV